MKRIATAQSINTLLANKRESLQAIYFVKICEASDVPTPKVQYCFALPERKWALDFAWPTAKLGLEVEGGIWSRGKHGRGSGILKDMEKANGLAVRGWRLLRVTPDQLLTTETLDLIRQALSR